MVRTPAGKVGILIGVWMAVFLRLAGSGAAAETAGPVWSEETEACIGCHESINPGIVGDWKASRHAVNTPAMGMEKPEQERRVSAVEVPEKLRSVVVGCYECHALNPESHADSFEHFGFQINVVVSPADCSACHPVEADQYAGSKKSEALAILRKNPVYQALVSTITGVKELRGEGLHGFPGTEHTKGETCYACHGTEIRVEGMKTVEVDGEEIEVPNLTNWPNQGVGRLNPDGSRGACTACHPRHSFSIEIARKPHTCSQCHLQPDVPAWDVYRESKHGNIALSAGGEWNWTHVPWRPGQDFRAPTCATCHNSLLVGPGGEQIAARTHDFGSRLWVRIFGLIYSHPQPLSGATYRIQNADGLPLPTTFTGQRAAGFLISPEEQGRRRREMAKVCRSCHSTDWAMGHFTKLDSTLAETDRMTLTATKLMVRAWDLGLADRENPFDEGIEQKWVKQWLFYANSVRYGSAMGGPDYAGFKNGWWDLTHNLNQMRDDILLKNAVRKK